MFDSSRVCRLLYSTQVVAVTIQDGAKRIQAWASDDALVTQQSARVPIDPLRSRSSTGRTEYMITLSLIQLL